MGIKRTVLIGILGSWMGVAGMLRMDGGMEVKAQRFRKVMYEAELVEGASYLLAAQTEDGQHKVLKQAETVSLKEERRLSCNVTENAKGELEVSGSEAAIFILEKGTEVSGKRRWYLKDKALQAYLCYNPEKITSTKYKACYTLPLTEVKGELCREFLFDFEQPGAFLVTARQISYTLSVKKPYYIRMSDTNPFAFRLYPESAGLAVSLYRLLEEPEVEVDVSGGWTFKGEWTCDSLCTLNLVGASSLDFSNAVLPMDWTEKGLLPSGEALVYALQEQVALLPQNKKNVVVLNKPSRRLVSGEVGGYLLSPMEWSEKAYGRVKYAFRIPTDGMFRLRRSFVGDGEWESCSLPFAVTVPADWEVSVFDSVGLQGAEFCRVQPGEIIPAGRACLMRCPKPSGRAFEYIFEAKRQVVPAAKEEWEVASGTAVTGFYGVCAVWEIPATSVSVYLLNAKGTAFVHALPGSWLNPWKAFLYLPQEKGEVKVHHGVDGIAEIGEKLVEDEKGAIYSLDGVLLYRGTIGKKQLQGLPQGTYILREKGKGRLWKK